MVRRLLGRRTIEGPHDLSDALAVALCHCASQAWGSAVERSARAGRR